MVNYWWNLLGGERYTLTPIPSAEVDSAKTNQYGIAQYDYDVHGSKRKLIKKEFNSNSYNGATLNDFVERLAIVFEAAESLVRQEETARLKDCESQAEKDAVLKDTTRKINKLVKKRDEAFERLKKDCVITPVTLSNLLKQEKTIVEIIKRASQHISFFVAHAIPIIQPDALYGDKKEYIKAIRRLEKEESELTARKGRPDLINTYPVKRATGNGDVTRISTHRVIGDTIIPSTKRDVAKLPNFAESMIGYKDSRGSVVTQFQGYRHSSYPPIKITDDFERKKGASITAKEMLTELARKKLVELGRGYRSGDHIEISLSSLVLLTPGFKYIEPWALGSISEYRQLKESYDALKMHHGRTITLNVDGNDVIVKPEINLINAALNPHGIYLSKRGKLMGNTWQSNLEYNINAEGMNQFIDDAEFNMGGAGQHSFSNKSINKLKDEVTWLKGKMGMFYGRLDLSLQTDDKKAHDRAERNIEHLQNKINKIEVQIMQKRRILFEKKKEDIKKLLENKSLPPTPLQQLYFQTVAMYMDGKIEPAHFGARYLLANRLMGKSVDYYCKSGEDRTGRMQNLLEELCEFERQYGRYPNYSFETKMIEVEDRKKQLVIAQTVSEFSVSRDITGHNARGARGLQIKDGQFGMPNEINTQLAHRMDDTLGKMARSVYDTKALLKVELKETMANALVEKNSFSGFETKVVRESERADYESTKHRVNTRVEAGPEISSNSVTYDGVHLKKRDLITSSQTFEWQDDPVLEPMVACLELNHRGVVRDVTKIPDNAPLVGDSGDGAVRLAAMREVAIQQAKLLLSQPHTKNQRAICIRGQDDAQVARVHAAVLLLQRSDPVLSRIPIKVTGKSMRPERVQKWSDSQKRLDDAFIRSQLGTNIGPALHEKKELSQLIKQQKQMKLVTQSGREALDSPQLTEDVNIKLD